MDLFRDFESETRLIQEKCWNYVSSLPLSLRQAGQFYLEQRRFTASEPPSRSIICLLPFWLGEPFNLKRKICCQVSLASAYALLYFGIQDEVMDLADGEYKGHLLPVGNLFLLQLIRQYRELFPSNSLFWSSFDGYCEEWANSTLWERENHWNQALPYSSSDLILLARKASLMKICCAAMALLAGQEAAIEQLAAMVDYNQVAFQLIDDLRDWRDDLARENYTYLLTQVMAVRGIQEPAKLTEQEVEKAFFSTDVLESVLTTAERYNRQAQECVRSLKGLYLKSYLASLSSLCQDVQRKTKAQREHLLRESLNLS